MLEPPLEIEIFLHPAAAGVQNQAGELQAIPFLQVLLNEDLPLARKLHGHPGITIPGKIDEVHLLVDPIKIDSLCATRCVTRESQLFLAGEGVDEAGLSY